MDKRHDRSFDLTYLLLITGSSFLLFALLLKIADGVNIRLFIKVGLVAFTLGLVAGASTLALKTGRKRKEQKTAAQNDAE